jgi:hypothetical protein
MKKLIFLLLVLIPFLAMGQCGCAPNVKGPFYLPNAVVPNCPYPAYDSLTAIEHDDTSQSDTLYITVSNGGYHIIVDSNGLIMSSYKPTTDSIPMSQYWDGHIDTPRTTKADIGDFFDLQDTLYGNSLIDTSIVILHPYDTIPVSFIYNLPNENRVRLMSGYRLDDDCGLCITTGNVIYLDEDKKRIPASWHVWLSYTR